MKAKKYLISLPPDLAKKAQDKSKKIFGRVNMSGMIAYLINKYESK